MAQRRSIAWSQLKVGLLVIVAFAALVVAVVRIGGRASLFSKQITITAYFPSANGLKPGAEIWLDGLLVGNVETFGLNRDPAIPGRVAVVMKIDEEYAPNIREDSEIGIDTIGLLGDKNIQLASGTGKVVGDGGVLIGKEVGDIRRIIQSTDDVVANFNELSDKLLSIFKTIEAGEGTLGRILTRTDIHDNLNNTVLELERLVQDIRSGPGTTGRLISDDELYQRFSNTLKRMEDVVAKVDNGPGTAAKLLNDPALYNNLERLVARMDGIAERIDRGEGTFGKILKDDAMYTSMLGTLGKVNTLVDEIGGGNGTTGKLIKDPSLFNTMNQAASEIQKLLYDFKQDPKRFLTINVKLF